MGKEQEETEEGKLEQQQKKKESLRSKAVHFVSDLTTVLLNPISDKPSKQQHPHDELRDSKNGDLDTENCSESSVSEPDTSSFTAFLYSLVTSSESQHSPQTDEKVETHEDDELKSPSSSEQTVLKENSKNKKKSIFSRGRQSLGRAFNHTLNFGGFLSHPPKGNSGMAISNGSTCSFSKGDEGICMKTLNESLPLDNNLPECSEPSLLLSEKTRSVLYTSLPVIVKGRKWMLLYSTWRHGISLSTLYRKSLLWPGLSLLVVGDCNGAVFGGLVEAPLRPSLKRYQGTKDSFVFTNTTGNPVIFRSTGINRYFTLCSTEYLAMGGGSHFALYLDEDLLSGSSSSSETYGNPCLARTRDFEVKGVELWGFVYASKFDEIIALSRSGTSGICQLVDNI